MQNLNEIIQSAHNGDAIKDLAEQFGISPQQAQAAVQALLPSLSMGLQQKMASGGFNQILGHLATQQNIDAYEDSQAAQTDEALASGQDVLNSLFGGADVAQQVAQHASEHSKLSADLLQSMAPIVAAMVAGGLFKSISSRGGLGGMFSGPAAAPAPPSPQPQAAGGGIGDILGQLLGGAQGAQGAGGLGGILGQLAGKAGQPGAGGLGDVLGQLAGKGGQAGGGALGDILGQLAAGKGQTGNAGLGGLLGSILGGAMSGGAAPSGAASPAGNLEQAAIQAGLQQLNNIFAHGTNVTPSQQSGLESILGQLLGGARR